MTMRIYDRENEGVHFSGRTSSSTAVPGHCCPQSEGSPMREFTDTGQSPLER
jgi:hypothetical protein